MMKNFDRIVVYYPQLAGNKKLHMEKHYANNGAHIYT